MVHAGVSHVAEQVTLESCANRSGYCNTDVKECLLQNGINMCGDEENLKTKLDLNRIKLEAEQFSVNLSLSDNVGR